IWPSGSSSSARRKRARSSRSSLPATLLRMPCTCTNVAWSCVTCPGPAGCALRAAGGRTRTISGASSTVSRAEYSLLLGKRRVEIDHGAVRILQLCVALAPERIPRLLVRTPAGVEQLAVHTVDLVGRLAPKGAAYRMSA